jgi:hypothetical protein
MKQFFVVVFWPQQNLMIERKRCKETISVSGEGWGASLHTPFLFIFIKRRFKNSINGVIRL